ncbi:hypothetical protein GGH13_002782 [Coemansia sp. S155-1]|nr:hypothetical protein LPJ71_002599 [Coemansia sp. S17]KAJ2072297.1 hypothetical protein GGH13_002782 [Coemansia sp. S155-1]
MRFFVILPALGCMLALCHAAVKVTLTNEAGEKESYTKNECYRVGRKFVGSKNKIVSTGGAVSYYSDSACKNGVFLDVAGDGTVFDIPSPIKSFMVRRYD